MADTTRTTATTTTVPMTMTMPTTMVMTILITMMVMVKTMALTMMTLTLVMAMAMMWAMRLTRKSAQKNWQTFYWNTLCFHMFSWRSILKSLRNQWFWKDFDMRARRTRACGPHGIM